MTRATLQNPAKVPPAAPDQVTTALARISSADPAVGRSAGEALAVLLADVRASLWPEIAWQFSRLGAGGCPIEFSFSSADTQLRYTVDPAGPETALPERLSIALRLIQQLTPGATVPGELTRLIGNAQTAADLRWGAWVGGRHSGTDSSFKLYAELPRLTATAPLARWSLPVTAPGGRCEVQLEGLGYDLARKLVELYYRVSHLDLSSLTFLLAQAGLADRLADLLDLLGEVLERPIRGYLPPLRFGFSLAADQPGNARTASLFCYTYEALGDDARCRSRILSVAGRRGLTLGVYPEVSAPLAAGGQSTGIRWPRSALRPRARPRSPSRSARPAVVRSHDRGGRHQHRGAAGRGPRPGNLLMAGHGRIPAGTGERPEPTDVGCLVPAVLDGQRPSGAFESTMADGGIQSPDENSFTTARILDALGDLATYPRLRAAFQRALAFLSSCEAPELPGTYRFWPDAHRPARVPRYPADVDDTVLVSLVLLRHHLVTRQQLRRLVARTLLSHRVRPGDRPARWVQAGAFMTWLDRDWPYNIVDCTVNANVVRLICAVGLRGIPGYEEACGTIAAGVASAAGDPALLRLISPYYATPLDLRDAVRRAVNAGATELRSSLYQLSEQLTRTRSPGDMPVCTSAYGRITWTCDLLRKLDACDCAL